MDIREGSDGTRDDNLVVYRPGCDVCLAFRSTGWLSPSIVLWWWCGPLGGVAIGGGRPVRPAGLQQWLLHTWVQEECQQGYFAAVKRVWVEQVRACFLHILAK